MSLGFPPRSAKREDDPRSAHFSSEALYALKAAAPFASASMIVGDDHGVRRPSGRRGCARERSIPAAAPKGSLARSLARLVV